MSELSYFPVLIMRPMYETGMHLQMSEQSRRHYGGGKHAEFEDDVMGIVDEKYGPGSQDTPSEWNVADIVHALEDNIDFWTRWNHVDHLCGTHRDLSKFCWSLKSKCLARQLEQQGGGGVGGRGKERGRSRGRGREGDRESE